MGTGRERALQSKNISLQVIDEAGRFMELPTMDKAMVSQKRVAANLHDPQIKVRLSLACSTTTGVA